MACCGGKRGLDTKGQTVLPGATRDYQEGQDGYVTLRYTGNTKIKIAGTHTLHWYWFESNSERVLDKNDAESFVKTGFFEIIVEEKENVDSNFAES